MKCALCHEAIDPENPFFFAQLVHDINPVTNRQANMHGWCHRSAIEALEPDAKNRYEEFCIYKRLSPKYQKLYKNPLTK